MDFKQFHYFVITAEELHVTHAAARLGITQPVLSQQIKAMEERLGLRLFDRKKRGIELTAAGAAFLLEARLALGQARKAVDVAKRIARSNVGTLEIGHVSSAPFDRHLFPALIAYQRDHPGIKLQLHSMPPAAQLDAMQAGQLNFAIVRTPLCTLPDELESFVFSSQRLVIALSTHHPLTRHNSLPLEVLAETSFIATLDPPGIGLGGALQALGHAAGFTPNIILQTTDSIANISLAATGSGICLVPDSLSLLKLPNVCFVPIQKIDTQSELRIVYRKYERSTALLALLSTLKDARQQCDSSG